MNGYCRIALRVLYQLLGWLYQLTYDAYYSERDLRSCSLSTRPSIGESEVEGLTYFAQCPV